MRRFATVGVLACLLVFELAFAGAQSVSPTRVVKFAAPETVPETTRVAECTASRAAWFRPDAMSCTIDKTSYDPCFRFGSPAHALCGIDPRKPGSGVIAKIKTGTADAQVVPTPAHQAWFIELTDGTTCQPLAAGVGGRELDGLIELYKCKWGASGEADAVLGDLDESEPVWTIRKVLINKKSEPQTIKSMTIATVKSVWR